MKQFIENQDLIIEKLEGYLNKSKAPLIIKDGDQYIVFKDYIIKENNNVYDLYKKHEYVDTVSTTAVALSWCLYDKYKKWNQAREILKSDRRIAKYMFEIENRKKLLEKTKDAETKVLHKIRMYEDIERLKEEKLNIKKCVNLTKYIKIKGFNDESK